MNPTSTQGVRTPWFPVALKELHCYAIALQLCKATESRE